MKSFRLLNIFIYFFLIENLNSQIVDTQWYVINNKGRSFGTVSATGQYPYGNILDDARVEIAGISQPSSLPVCASPPPPPACQANQARNDLFIIYEDGSYYNSNGSTTPINWSTLPFILNNDPKIQYFYFSNIYEDDDPPQNIVVSNSSLGVSNPLPTVPIPSHDLTSSHDIVRNKDFTLVIPGALIKDNCSTQTIDLKVEPVTISGAYIPVKILKLNNTFNGSWSYHSLGGSTVNSINNYTEIKNIGLPPGLNGNHFINFNADFENDPNLIGKTVKIEAFCSTNPTNVIASLTPEISDIHDPNFIEVKCIYKKKKPWYCPWCHDRYFVKYYVEFMNDGNMPVNSVIVNFILPDIAIPSTFIVGKWKYGTNTSCGNNPAGILNYSIPATSNVSVSLSEYSDLSVLGSQNPADLSVHLPNQYGGFEFCVEVNQNPTLYNSWSLQPQSPTTNFDGVVYPIQNFLDPYITIDSIVESNIVKTRKRSIGNIWKNCNCACLQTQSNSQSGNHN